MNTFLWIVQGALAAMFGLAGVMKTLQPREKLAAQLPWVEDFSTGTVRFIGIAEFAGALGLILPAATGIAPILTPVAAVCLAVVMAMAAVVHARRKEPSAIAFNAALAVVSLIVAWGRFGPYAF